MAANQTAHFAVHLGTWTNWSKGPVYGVTLTLTRSNANLLIAFVAFFVAAVGTRFWRIVCLITHHLYSTPMPQDGLHHQRQATLRNAANPETAIVVLFQLLWAWRHRARRSLLRLLIALLLATALLVGFTVASGFSSKISAESEFDSGTEVLLDGSNCGTLDQIDLLAEVDVIELTDNYETQAAQFSENSANYAKNCYGFVSGGDAGLGCSTFAQKRLPYSVARNASCPFAPEICKTQDANLIIDTGLLDSHTHFGLNAPPGERWQQRWQIHCAPLITNGYKSVKNMSSSRSYTLYKYGSRPKKSTFSYQFTNDAISDFEYTSHTTGLPDYTVGTVRAYWSNGSFADDISTFDPIPELVVPDAKLAVFFLSAGSVIFSSRVTDLMYSATKQLGSLTILMPDGTEKFLPVYGQDEPASPLGCAVRQQVCNSEGRCSSLTGESDVLNELPALFPDESSFDRIMWGLKTIVAFQSDFGEKVLPEYLLSRDSLSGGVQALIDENQWQKDVEYWFAIVLAGRQAGPIHTTLGEFDQGLMSYVRKPNDTEASKLCTNQKILSSEYVNFSVLGIGLVFSIGGLIMVVSLVLEPIMACLRRRRGIHAYQQLEWCSNEALQLQRMAYEGIGAGTWSGGAGSVPVTEPGEKLALLDLEDQAHPRLLPSASAAGGAVVAVHDEKGSSGSGGRTPPDAERGAEVRIAEIPLGPSDTNPSSCLTGDTEAVANVSQVLERMPTLNGDTSDMRRNSSSGASVTTSQDAPADHRPVSPDGDTLELLETNDHIAAREEPGRDGGY